VTPWGTTPRSRRAPVAHPTSGGHRTLPAPWPPSPAPRGSHLVVRVRSFLWLSAPGLSRSGSPFLAGSFRVFLLRALLTVEAQCLGSSCRPRAAGYPEPWHRGHPIQGLQDQRSPSPRLNWRDTLPGIPHHGLCCPEAWENMEAKEATEVPGNKRPRRPG